ncbi:sigma-54-dependent transcriptional regulator [Aestuariispira insulae]|uniref:Two-component system repressor protein LuxO n=1 Tax=Aestuariispira insulae TaxID=1461337 RepID=A0A3D9H2R8_9PROT|nr:sigma-54 dependent transcriptional regulator [Aestuariispira insulae]RED43784.1 two-component system repressor protein LuxO [Aestuariispira insulae]
MADILLVEDSPTNAAMYAAYLEQADHKVTDVNRGHLAVEAISEKSFDLVVLDLKLPDMNGLQVLEELPKGVRRPPTIVLTGNGSVRTAVDAMRAGALDFLMKPCSGDKLVEAVGTCLERSTIFTEEPEVGAAGTGASSKPAAKKNRAGPSGFLGQSPAMTNVFSLIENAAQSNASVFITGESGTGKELCAQAIHKASPRANGPFVAINCAAIPRDLMESEIFGHRKGAFTGAVNDREGAAALADGGTLFLDELCEMDLDLQAKLLRFIQTGVYKRVGDGHERETDIRFVCATNRDPLQEVREKRFREDLYYRLHVIPIGMPALRERGGDTLFLAKRFLADFSAIEKKAFDGFDPEAAAKLETYAWPGNVRELQNVVQNVVVMNGGGMVRADMLPPPLNGPMQSALHLSMNQGASDPGQTDGAVDTSADALLVRPMEELEILAIDAAIRKFNGNVTKAARALEISTSSIYRKKKSWAEKTGEPDLVQTGS